MNLTINAKTMNAALKRLSPAISSNVIMPILDNVFLSIQKDKCSIVATNNILRITVKNVPCTAGQEGELLLPFKQMLDLSGKLGSDVLQISEDKSVITAKCGKDKFKLGKKEPANEFPKAETSEEVLRCEVDGDILYYIQVATRCLGHTDPRFADVCLDIKDGNVNVVGTDMAGFFRYRQKVDCSKKFRGLLDSNFIKSLNGIGEAELVITERRIRIEAADIEISVAQRESNMPDYDHILESGEPNCSINKSELLRAIEKIMILRNDSTFHQVKLEFRDGSICVSYDDIDLEQHYDTEIDAEHSVRFLKTVYNAKMVQTFLSTLPDVEDVLHIFFRENGKQPMSIKAEGISLSFAPLQYD